MMLFKQLSGKKQLRKIKWRAGGCCLLILLILLLGCGGLVYLSREVLAQEQIPASQQILLLVDNSQSMFDTSDPDLLRIEAARLFITYLGVDSSRTAHQLGVIFFGTEAETRVPLTALNDDLKRKDILGLIANPPAMGWTNPQAALDLADGAFDGAGATDTGQAIILLTDGKPEWRKDPSATETEQVIARLKETAGRYSEQGIPLFIILLHDADVRAADPEIEAVYVPLWQEMAQTTPGGRFYRIDRSETLIDIYHDIVVSLTRRQSDGVVIETVVQTETVERVPVEDGLAQMTFVIRKSNPELAVAIFQPDGSPLSSRVPGVKRAGAGLEEIWAIDQPQPGVGAVQINGQGEVKVWKDFYPAPPTPTLTPSATPTLTPTSVPTKTPSPTLTPTSAPLATHTPLPTNTPLLLTPVSPLPTVTVPASDENAGPRLGWVLGVPAALLGLAGGGWADDDRTTGITYVPPSFFDPVTNRPDQITVSGSEGIVAQTDYRYLYQSGDGYALSSVTVTQTDTITDSPPLVSYTHFDDYGNVDLTWSASSDRYISISYDDETHTYPSVITYPGNLTESFEYNAGFGMMTSYTNMDGGVTTWEPNDFGRLQREEGPNGIVTYEYSDDDGGTTAVNGLLVTAARNDDYETKQYYNGLGQLDYTIVPGGIGYLTTRYTYDGLGRLISTTIPYTNVVAAVTAQATTYDALGRPLSTRTLDGTTDYAYDGWQTVVITDALTHAKTYGLDAFGRVTGVTEYNGASPLTTIYEYNTLGDLIRITDPDDNITEMVYDSLGHKRQMIDPDMGTWTYTYNAAGDLDTQTDARGVETILGYDTLGRVITKIYDTTNDLDVAVTRPVTYTYNGGQRTRMEDGSGETQWRYDDYGRLLTETKTIDGSVYTTSYTYGDGLLQSMTYPDGEVVTFAYNTADELTGVNGDDGIDSTTYLADAIYNQLGQPVHWELRNDVAQTFVYTTSFRPETVSAGSLQNLDFGFDGIGHLTSWNDNSAYDLNYKYDDLNRLYEVALPNDEVILDFGYDNIGNLTSLMRGNDTLSFPETGFVHPHAPTSDSDGNTYTYDDNGNLTGIITATQSISYTYDAENRLVEAISGTQVTTYTYTGDGERVMQETDNGEAMHYVGDYYEAPLSTTSSYDFHWVFDDSEEIWILDDWVWGDAFIEWSGYSGGTIRTYVPLGLAGSFMRMDRDLQDQYYFSSDSVLSLQYIVTSNSSPNPIEITALVNTGGSWIQVAQNTVPSGTTTDWVTLNIDLSGYEGRQLTSLRIRLEGNPLFGTSYCNIYVDNVSITNLQADNYPTKHYFTPEGTPLATRVGDNLYHNLPDPSGSSLTYTDETGVSAGRILFDPYGGVLENSIPIDSPLMRTLNRTSLPNTDTGLVHLGNGRYYNPALGRPLQPNPAGGAPTVPQSLNRYAATSLGQVGVAEGAVATTSLSWLREQIVKTPLGLTLGDLSSRRFGDALDFALKRTVRFQSFVTSGREIVNRGFDYKMPRSFIKQKVSVWEEMGYEYTSQTIRKSRSIIREHIGLAPEISGSPYRTVEKITEEFSPGYIGFKSLAADLGIGLLLDTGFQIYGDWDNPYLTTRQKIRRAEISGVGSLGITAVGLGIRGGLIYLEVGSGPAGWIALGGTLLADYIWGTAGKPVVFEYFGSNSTRNLYPLQE